MTGWKLSQKPNNFKDLNKNSCLFVSNVVRKSRKTMRKSESIKYITDYAYIIAYLGAT